jgi:hypothetical protein
MGGARFPRGDRLGGEPLQREIRNRMNAGIFASVLIAGVLVLAIRGPIGSSAQSPTETPPPSTPSPAPVPATPFPSAPGPAATPYPTYVPAPAPQPAAPAQPPSGGYVPSQQPADVSTWSVPVSPILDNPFAASVPTPLPEATPDAAVPPPDPNRYWLGRARAIGNRYWLGEYFVRQMMQESGFSDDVILGQRVSWAGAEGIAQIMRAYHPKVDPLNPEAALDYAAQHMADLLLRYDGSMSKALGAYNAGAGTVDEAIAVQGDNWLGWMPLESQEYIATIMQPGDPDRLPRWDDLKQWWTLATEGLSQRLHLRLLLSSMVGVGAVPPPPPAQS